MDPAAVDQRDINTRRTHRVTAAIAGVVLVSAVLAVMPVAGASRADISAVDFRAAAPYSYVHATGGGRS